MTNMKRVTIGLPPSLEDRIVELRKTERFCRCSTSEIVRFLIESALDNGNDAPPAPHDPAA